MIRLFLPAVLALIGLALVAAEPPTADLAQRLKKVELKLYARAPGYTEGPTWRDGELFFCSGGLMHVDKAGWVEKYLDVKPAGTVLRSNGHLLLCDNKHKAILDLSPQGVLGVVADQYEGKPLRSLNDLTVDARGNVYWTDPDGSSVKDPIGSIFRVTPKGQVSRIATELAFPNGVEVDPASKFLYVIESQSKKILRYPLPDDAKPLGKAEVFFHLGGSGGDGCAFDAEGNLWVADFHRPETNRGRLTVLSPQGKVLATLEVLAKVVSNLTFGGPDRDEVFCTTGTPDGVFRAKVGVKGFAGHPAKELKIVREIAIQPEDPASAVHPRRFGLPGGIGATRGWYIWRKFDPETWQAEVSHERTGEKYTVRVLPWLTTYRRLVYGASPEELLPGERVNLFFNPEGSTKRAYLVHFQDELCQMRGHNHAWQVEAVAANGKGFTARGMAGDKPLDDKAANFVLDEKARLWRGGKPVETAALKKGERLFLTWCLRDKRRVVKLLADAASLEALQAEQRKRVAERIGKEGMAGFVDNVEGAKVRVLVFATYWSQARALTSGQSIRLQATDAAYRGKGDSIEARVVSRKNLGTYGSGTTELLLEAATRQTEALRVWVGGKVVRVFGLQDE